MLKLVSLRQIFSLPVISLAVVLLYVLLSVLNGPPLIRFIAAFPAVYIVPGLLFILQARSHNENRDVKELVLESFLLSTIINVILIAFLVFIGVENYNFAFLISYVIFMIPLFLLSFRRLKKINVKLQKLNYTILACLIISFLVLATAFSYLPHNLTVDETSYIAGIRDILQKGQIISWGASSSQVLSLLDGRVFWLLSGASLASATGLVSYQLNLLSVMFLPMMGLTASLLIPSSYKNSKWLQIIAFLLTVTNPLLIEFSSFILNDLALSFYVLVSVMFFVKSFKIGGETGPATIELSSLLLSFLSLFIAVLIKPNVVVILPLFLILVGFIVYYRMYKVKRYKIVLATLLIPTLLYEFIIDIPYVLVVWTSLANQSVRNAIFTFLKPLISFGSPAEFFLNWFVPTSWNPRTILSYNYVSYTNFIYRFLSPEMLGILVSSIALVLPFVLLVKDMRENIQFRILTIFTASTAILYLFASLASGDFGDINRYCLFVYPLFSIVAILVIYQLFLKNRFKTLLAFIAPSVLLLLMNILLSEKTGGATIGFGLSPMVWTQSILLGELILVIVLFASQGKFGSRSFIIVHRQISFRKIVASLLIISIISNGVYFAGVFLVDSTYFKNEGLITVGEHLTGLNSTIIFSNSFIYLRSFVTNEVYSNNYLLSAPITQTDLNDFLSKGYNGTTIVAFDSSSLTTFEYSNAYKNNLTHGIFCNANQSINLLYKDKNSAGSAIIYQINGSVQLHKSVTDIFVDNIGVDSSNHSYPTLKMNIRSPRATNLTVIVGTSSFSKILNAHVGPGNNSLAYPFERVLANGDSYGLDLANQFSITIIDVDGNIIYNNVIANNGIAPCYLIFYIVLLIAMAIIFVMLSARLSFKGALEDQFKRRSSEKI